MKRFNPLTPPFDFYNIENGTAQGQMAFWDATLKKWTFTETSELLWDDTNKYIGLGVPPRRKLDVLDATNPQLRLTHTDGSVYTDFQIDSSGNLYIRNTGDSVAIGNLAGNGQTRTTAFGAYALRNNTGNYSTGVGYNSLANNAGEYSSGVGYASLVNNVGVRSNGIGFSALNSNIGGYSNGFGMYALRYNTGIYSSGFGYQSLQNNTGNYATGLGNRTLYYNQGANNTAIGYNAWADFLENTAGNKTFDNTDVNATTDRVTVTAHGFGANGTYINIKYTQGTSAITGLTDGTVYQVKIIDADTIGFYEADGPAGASRGTNITDAGTGTGHTLTPQFTYTNSIVIGDNVNPTASNQINIGDTAFFDTANNLFGVGLIPTARITLPAGTTSYSPLKFTAGTALTTPQAGTLEYHDDRLYVTNVATRRAVDRTSGVITSTTTVSDTTTETTIFTGTLEANALKVGNLLKVNASGLFSTANASDSLTIRVKLGSTTISSIALTPKNYTDEHWDVNARIVVRSVGATGTVSTHCDLELGDDSGHSVNETVTIDTTSAENLTITAQWSSADASNTVSAFIGYLEFKN